MTPKPICVISIPEEVNANMNRIKWSDCLEMQQSLEKDKPDYHWFVVLNFDITSLEFKVFYDKDFTEIQYQELKQLIVNHTKTIQP